MNEKEMRGPGQTNCRAKSGKEWNRQFCEYALSGQESCEESSGV